MFKRKVFFLGLFLFFFTSPLVFAADAKTIITNMIQKMRGHTNISEYEMTVQRTAWTRSVRMKIWDDRSHKRVFVRILEPAKDKGISFLRLDYNLWNYLPSVEKVMKIPPSMMLQPWMGSDFTNDDLVKESSYIDDYEHTLVSHEIVGGEEILQMELIPHPHAPVVWGKVIYWVRKKDNLPVKQHFLDEKGRLIKELEFSNFKVLDGVLLPTRWEMKPVLKPGEKTILTLVTIDFDPVPAVPAFIFTEKNLKNTGH